VSLALELAQTVAVGPFNPYIVTPEWLIRFKVCDENEANKFTPGMATDGTGAMVTDGTAFQIGGFEWAVDYRRLMVSAARIESDCGQKVAVVMGLLPHTPVKAIGNNFHFVCSLKDWAGKPWPQLGAREAPPITGVQHFRWVASFDRQGANIEVTLLIAPRAEVVAILFNHDRRTDPQNHETAVEAAKQFKADYNQSGQMLRDLFGVELKI
jgi:hypothetical protein